jgi:molybdopterin-containing oxidoreductase family membrane subunit
MFWGGLVIAGCIIPAVVLFHPRTGKSIPWIVFASVLAVFGVLCERYLIVIPGQTFPPDLLPNMEITGAVGPAFDEGVVSYAPSIHEVFQALGVVALIGFMFVVGLRLFKLLPREARIYEQAA